MAEAMTDAHSDVFAVNQEAYKASSDDLKGIFARVSGKSDAVAEKMALTFRALAAHADFGSMPPSRRPTLATPRGRSRSRIQRWVCGCITTFTCIFRFRRRSRSMT